jgi:hypothetical protein
MPPCRNLYLSYIYSWCGIFRKFSYSPADEKNRVKTEKKSERIFIYPDRILSMNFYGILLMTVVISGVFIAGCTQLSGTAPVTTVVPVTTLPAPEPATPVPTPAPTAAETAVPQQVVTLVHTISLVRDVKDSELMFALQIPEEWNISTSLMDNPENFEGKMYQTDLVGNNTFYIITFTDYREREQNFRDQYQAWSPAPAATAVTINGITFDRFESTADGWTRVGYVPRKGSTNEQGYLSVLYFNASTGNRFDKEDYDKVVSSFRYISKYSGVPAPGEEIYKVPVPKEESGGTKSAVGSGSSTSSGSGSSSGGSRCRR